MDVVREWSAVRDLLLVEGRRQLADDVARFVNQMPPPRKEKELLVNELMELARQSRAKDRPLVR